MTLNFTTQFETHYCCVFHQRYLEYFGFDSQCHMGAKVSCWKRKARLSACDNILCISYDIFEKNNHFQWVR